MEESKVKTLGEISTSIQYGYTASAAIENVGPKLLRITDIQNGNVNWNSVPYCLCDDPAKYLLGDGDIVFARTGATTGKSFIIENAPQAVFASYLIRLRLKPNYFPKFVYYFFQSEKYWEEINRNITGSTQGGFNASKLSEIKIPLPDLKTQQKIAGILEKADIARQKRKQANQLTEQFLQSAFLEMFGDPVRNEKGWEVKKLREISTKIHSGNTPKGGSAVYVKQGITFFRSQNVWKNRFDFEDIAYIDINTHHKMMKSSLMCGDILMTKTGRFNTENSSLGRAALYLGEDNKANVNGHVYLIRLQKYILRKFVLFILTTNEYRDYIRSVCVGGIDKRQLNKEHLENFPIICPPISHQKKFTALVEQVEQLRVKQRESEKELENLFQSLMQRYFEAPHSELASPKIDVIKPNAISPPIAVNRKGFAKQVLGGKIVSLFKDDKNFTHIKFQKLQYLAEHIIQADLKWNYYRQAAGPYDPKFMHTVADKLQGNKWFEEKKYKFFPLGKADEVDGYYQTYFEDADKKLSQLFSLLKNATEKHCEAIATVYAVWNNMIIQNENPSDKKIVCRFFEWSPRKAGYTEKEIVDTIAWIRKKEFTPTGFGYLIKEAKRK